MDPTLQPFPFWILHLDLGRALKCTRLWLSVETTGNHSSWLRIDGFISIFSGGNERPHRAGRHGAENCEEQRTGEVAVWVWAALLCKTVQTICGDGM